MVELGNKKMLADGFERTVREGRIDLLKQTNARDREIFSEVNANTSNSYHLLKSTYLDLRNQHDDLVKRFNDLEMLKCRLENEKGLKYHEKNQVSSISKIDKRVKNR